MSVWVSSQSWTYRSPQCQRSSVGRFFFDLPFAPVSTEISSFPASKFVFKPKFERLICSISPFLTFITAMQICLIKTIATEWLCLACWWRETSFVRSRVYIGLTETRKPFFFLLPASHEYEFPVSLSLKKHLIMWSLTYDIVFAISLIHETQIPLINFPLWPHTAMLIT